VKKRSTGFTKGEIAKVHDFQFLLLGTCSIKTVIVKKGRGGVRERVTVTLRCKKGGDTNGSVKKTEN